jgi:Fe-S cluster assembly protein SufD
MNVALSSLDVRRAEAGERFRLKGVPHRRIEEWKYSDLRAALDAARVEAEGSAQWRIEKLPEGVELFDLSSPKAPEWVTSTLGVAGGGAMEAASLAFAKSGVALRVTKSGTVRLNLSGEGHVRVLVVVEENAVLTLVETQEGDAVELRNIGTEFVLSANAGLAHVRLAPNASKSVQVETIAAKLAKGATYRAHFANFGAKLSRTDVNVMLEGEGAEAHLSGVSVLSGGHADVTTHVEHAVGNTHSTQLFKHVAGGQSRAIYQGKITVAHGANGSDSRQTAKGLLLSAKAEIDLKPELEIFADDVKCAHGAAVGDLDTESLFYLRTRGIPESEARALLMRAFLEDSVAEIENEDIRAQIWLAVEAALAEADKS